MFVRCFPRSSALPLLVFALITGACGDPRSRGIDLSTDSGVDGGHSEHEIPTLDIPGQRPTLSSPGQVVPLLYGRSVVVEDARGSTPFASRIPLDDPNYPAHQAFFSDLTLACRAEVRAKLGVENVAWEDPARCSDGAVARLSVKLCMASAGRSFAGPSPSGQIRWDGAAFRLELEAASAAGEGTRFLVNNQGLHERASWAMFAVAQYRDVMGDVGLLFEPMYCSQDESTAGARGRALALMLEAAREIENASEQADGLLSLRLQERFASQTDSNDARVAYTRGLSESLLERLKLYGAMPYGAFVPVDGETITQEDADGRYPALYTPDEVAARGAWVLSVLRTPVMDEAGLALSEGALKDAFWSTLRESAPLLFGGMGDAEVDDALTQLSLTDRELSTGAGWLRQVQRVAGVSPVWRTLADGESKAFESLGYGAAPLAPGYVHAITEARSTPSRERGPLYTARSTADALAYAQRVARIALRGGVAPELAGELQTLADSDTARGHAELCLQASSEGQTLGSLRVLELRADQVGPAEAPRFELYQESDIACALAGEKLGRPCAEPPSLFAEYDAAAGALAFAFDTQHGASFYLTERGLDDAAPQRRALVGVFSLRPLDALEVGADARCGEVALNRNVHAPAARVHREDGVPVLSRSPALSPAGVEVRLRPSTPVPPGWGRNLGVMRDGTPSLVAFTQPFDAARVFVERALRQCAEFTRGRGAGDKWCEDDELRELDALRCQVDALRAEGAALSSFTVSPESAEQAFARALWTYQSELELAVVLADKLAHFECIETATAAGPEVPMIASQLWDMAAQLATHLEADFLTLLTTAQERVVARWQGEADPVVRAEGITRALQDSRLAAARLLLAVPARLHTGEEEPGPLGGALTRFPALTALALTAEDTRAEQFLRTAGLHPLLPDLTLSHGKLVPDSVAGSLTSDAMLSRLRTRLVAVDPASYASLPSASGALLGALGVSRGQLAGAATRLVQLSEARGASLLAAPGVDPVVALGLEASDPPPRASQLYALSEGRLHAALDAWPTSVGVRGVYHALSVLEGAMVKSLLATSNLAASEQARRIALQEGLARRVRPTRVAFETFPNVAGLAAPELLVPLEAQSPSKLLTRYELWWTDAGALCATEGKVWGEACVEADFRFGHNAATVTVEEIAETISGLPAARISGLHWPLPTGWDPQRTTELERTRLYLTRLDGSERVLVGSVEIEAGQSGAERLDVPDAESFSLYVRELLAYREPGEGCGDCRPGSVCESTACEFGLCLRTALSGNSCAADGECVNGVCDKPGCGDGARSDGTGEVPYEACDDGNLVDDDGCSAMCSVETRSLEPLIQEGWPAGPAPAIAVDGLGRALLVYMADDLVGETVRIRAARFDAFGRKEGPEFDLATGIARGYRALPTLAGLSEGGFVVAYASANVENESGLALRLVDVAGASALETAVDDNGSAQTDPRVVAVEDGFVVSWVEQSAVDAATSVRLRRFGPDGVPHAASVRASPAQVGVSQRQPTLVSSLGQVFVGWSEVVTTGGLERGVFGRRFSGALAPVDANVLELAKGAQSEPSASVNDQGDYLVAWTNRAVDAAGDLALRSVRRFGMSPLGEVQSVLTGAEATSRPVLAAGSTGWLLAHQLGSPFSVGAALGLGMDADALELAREELALSNYADVSAVRVPQGIWLVWSRRVNARRALFGMLLPPG